MLHTKIQPQSLLGSWEENLSVLPYMDTVAILDNGPWPFVQIFNLPLKDGST